MVADQILTEKIMWELGELKFNYLRAVSTLEAMQKRISELEASVQKSDE
jgi:hypothetical protein